MSFQTRVVNWIFLALLSGHKHRWNAEKCLNNYNLYDTSTFFKHEYSWRYFLVINKLSKWRLSLCYARNLWMFLGTENKWHLKSTLLGLYKDHWCRGEWVKALWKATIKGKPTKKTWNWEANRGPALCFLVKQEGAIVKTVQSKTDINNNSPVKYKML